jgi:hypothetical protein
MIYIASASIECGQDLHLRENRPSWLSYDYRTLPAPIGLGFHHQCFILYYFTMF